MFLFMWTINVLVVRRNPDYLAVRMINDHDVISKFKTYLSYCFQKDLGVIIKIKLQIFFNPILPIMVFK